MGRKGLFSAFIFFLFLSEIRAQSAFEFIENKGQWDSRVQFKGEFPTGAFFLQQKGFTVLLNHPDDLLRLSAHHGHDEKSPGKGKTARKNNARVDVEPIDHSGRNDNPAKTVRSHAYVVEFAGASENAEIAPDKIVPGLSNYIIGDDPSKWASNVKSYQAVLYKNIYPQIDLRYYSEGDRLKYDLIIHPGGDPRNIAMKYTGAEKLSVRNRELIIKTSVGETREEYPYTFQPDDVKGRKEIDCKYVVAGNNTVRFELGEYDKNALLIIDPTLIFSSFTGSTANQYGFTATPGPDGSLYSGGIVFGSGFPTTPGAFQSSFQGGSGQGAVDIGIMKFSANGSQRVYATYLGGNGNDFPHSLFCDPQGNLVVMGRSYSSNYPGTKVPTATNGTPTDANIIVTKLNSNGSAYIGSLIIGGSGPDGVNIKDLQNGASQGGQSLVRNYGDDSRSEVILDGANNIYVAAQTHSIDFPIYGAVSQTTLGGMQDGVVMKINPNCTSIIWSTYLGGSQDDGAFVLELDPMTNNIYVGGGTNSADLPGDKSGTIGSSYTPGSNPNDPLPDGFVAILNNNGQLLKSTYIGTNRLDIIYGLKFDRLGFPYIMGITRGAADWTVVNATYYRAGSSQFIAKLQPDLSGYVYSTLFGSGTSRPNMSPVAFLVDRCENVYISGWGGWINTEGSDPYDMAGLAGMDITPDALKSITDNRDFYFGVIAKNATHLLYGTFFGQEGGNFGEHVDGGTSRYDQQGVIYQAMCANCYAEPNIRFPTTPGVIGPTNGTRPRPGVSAEGCNLAAVKISFNFAGVASGPKSFYNNAPDSIGCAPFTVTLRDTVRNGKTFEWDLDGDGVTDTITSEFELTHTFTDVRTYRVRQIAVDSSTCNMRDTAYVNIYVRDDQAFLRMEAEKQQPCESLSYEFRNLSTLSPTGKPFGPESFIWDFGDGVRTPPMGSGSVTHNYTAPGTYQVKLILADMDYCNSPDSITLELRVAPLVKAQFETPNTGCAPYEAVFTNTSLAGQTFTWDFGDGSSSNEVNPTHLYQTPATYTITLTAFDDGTCNRTDVTSKTITVAGKPTAAFTHTPVLPQVNTPTIFYNQSSQDGILFKWLFGDGDSTIKTTRDTTLHQYQATGVYNACLIVYNIAGCPDTVCHEVRAEINPLLDVPNAFTPGRFGKNARVNVEGFGIGRMVFRIYNRWGQKVFETNDRRIGWDGTFNGQPQPMDVYGYTLDVEFTDGTKTRKTGDITLIR